MCVILVSVKHRDWLLAPAKDTTAPTAKRRTIRDSDDSEDEPLVTKRPRASASSATRLPPSSDMDVDSEDEPVTSSSQSSAKPLPIASSSKKRTIASDDDDDLSADNSSDSEDEPIGKSKINGRAKKPATAAKKRTVSRRKADSFDLSDSGSDDADDSDTGSSSPAPAKRARAANGKPAAPAKGKAKAKAEAAATTAAAKGKAKAKGKGKGKAGDDDGDDEGAGDDDEGDSEFKWWLLPDPLNENGVKWTSLRHNGVLFPPEYEPHGIQIKYDGRPVKLGAAAEEVATFYAGILGTQHEDNATFKTNFFTDFRKIIKDTEPADCPIKEFDKCDFTPIADHLAAERERKKNMTKAEKEAAKQERPRLTSSMVEPPGLFRGRGEHPKAGKLKTRVRPEDIVINIGAKDPVPEPPKGHKWKDVVHDNTVTWLATWTENVNGQTKYVFLSAASSWKGMSDFKKFETARKLKKEVKFALRAGNEKGEDEADTVGCCSLRYEHVTLRSDNVVVFDFLGKDSIRYYNEVTVDPQVHKNLRLFKKDKEEGDDLFDRIDTSSLNKHLTGLMKGLTAKVFRTYNASFTFQQEVAKTPEDGTVEEKVLAYNRANREVAVLCNHQRAVPKTFNAQMDKMKDKLRALKYQRREIKRQIVAADPKLKRKRKDLTDPESDLDEEWIASYLESEKEKEAEKDAKKLEKLNEERKAAGEKPLKALPKKEKKDPTVEQLEKKLEQMTARIEATRVSMTDKDENKTTALGTSKINYIDPRITAAWCKKYGVPIERMFPKTLREKFKWAMDVDADWEF
ncbi:hypothetical protein BCR44DRAFT_1434373 [Catenaria anguillulae PL171]|uniref:DNA topoisomerase I n=1 Tax=Catenaria anguillulae PL171 TaxID=765915 RepID=A0A1Y2HQW3_9FUNG|nr:hypothetical protein BCR44DRAFT_1434373 [Catenaria anguillulae PL171]